MEFYETNLSESEMSSLTVDVDGVDELESLNDLLLEDLEEEKDFEDMLIETIK